MPLSRKYSGYGRPREVAVARSVGSGRSVRSGLLLDGETTAIPAALSVGRATMATVELNGPTTPITVSSAASAPAARAPPSGRDRSSWTLTRIFQPGIAPSAFASSTASRTALRTAPPTDARSPDTGAISPIVAVCGCGRGGPPMGAVVPPVTVSVTPTAPTATTRATRTATTARLGLGLGLGRAHRRTRVGSDEPITFRTAPHRVAPRRTGCLRPPRASSAAGSSRCAVSSGRHRARSYRVRSAGPPWPAR